MRRVQVLKFKGPIKGYVINYLRQNYWRVEGLTEYEDLLQDAEYIFLKLKKRYKIDNGAHMMSLFKTSWANHFNKIANRRTRNREYEKGPIVTEEDENSLAAITESNNGYLLCLLEQAPEEVRSVMALLAEAPRELLDEVAKAWRQNGRRSVEGNKHLSELLGYSSDTDLIKAVKDYLS